MSIRRTAIILVVLLACWMGGYAFLTRDPDATAYREMCLTSAHSALDGLDLARRATDPHVFGTFRTAATDDAQKMISQARSTLAAQSPPDDRSARRRDTLLPLLDQAERVYEDIAEHGGTGAAAAVEQQLREFISDNS